MPANSWLMAQRTRLSLSSSAQLSPRLRRNASSSPKVFTLAATSTQDPSFKEQGGRANMTGAVTIGKLAAERAKLAGITTVVFDRGGFRYHGRIKAIADAARESGLKF